MNNLIAIALMKNAAGKTLAMQTKEYLSEDSYQSRKEQIRKLMILADIPMTARHGCTSKAERLGKALARQGGQKFDEAIKTLTYAEFSSKSWAKAMDLFA